VLDLRDKQKGKIMAKICPITNKSVLYLDCLECEEKICRKTKNIKKEEPSK